MRKAFNSSSVLFAATAAVSLTLLSSGSARAAAPVIDGTLDAGVYTQFATQTVQTGFGPHQSELDAGYVHVENNKLYMMLSGNLESNFNKQVIFIDSKAGGQNIMRGDNANVDFNNLNTKYAGMTFDSGFSPDYVLFWSRDTGNVYLNYAELNTNGGGLGGFVGQVATPNANQQGSGTVGGTGGLPKIDFGYSDANVLGIGGAAPAAADPALANAVTTGQEFGIELDALGIDGPFKAMIGINGSNHDFWSNQFFPGLTAPQGNLGGDGAGTFNGSVAGVNFTAVPGDQFQTFTAPAAVTYNWAMPIGTPWSSSSSWSGGVVPNASFVHATLGNTITSAATVTIDTPILVHQLTFDSTKGYTVDGSSMLTINGDPTKVAVDVLSGLHTISAPVTLASGTRFDIATGSQLIISGPLTATGQNIFKQGAGSLVIPPVNVNSITVNAGVLKLNGTANTTVKGVTVNSPGALDLASGTLIVNYDAGFSPLAALKTTIASGVIVSSTIAQPNTAIGYLDTAALPLVTAFNGDTVDADTLIFRKTLIGDTNLDRIVNFADLLTLAQNYDVAGSGKEWYTGDFNGDGVTNFSDLLPLAQNYGATVTGSFAGDWALAQSLVPEPTSIAAIGLGAASMLIRRRRSV